MTYGVIVIIKQNSTGVVAPRVKISCQSAKRFRRKGNNETHTRTFYVRTYGSDSLTPLSASQARANKATRVNGRAPSPRTPRTPSGRRHRLGLVRARCTMVAILCTLRCRHCVGSPRLEGSVCLPLVSIIPSVQRAFCSLLHSLDHVRRASPRLDEASRRMSEQLRHGLGDPITLIVPWPRSCLLVEERE